jgi:hypothetical protein
VIADRVYRTYLRTPPSWRSGERVSVEAEVTSTFCAAPTISLTFAGLEPTDADPSEVARQIVRVVDLPFGKRPFRVHVDPSQDGAEIVNSVADRMRREMYRNIGLEDLLHPAVIV